MTHSWHRITFVLALSLTAAAVPVVSIGAQTTGIQQLSLFGGVNATSNSSPFADALVALNVGGAADIRMLPLTIRLTGEFDQVPRGGTSRKVISGAADILSPSVGLFRGARLYAFAGPGLYRYSGYKQAVPSNQGSILLTVPTTTHVGLNAGFALDFGHVFLQAKGVATTGTTYFPVSIGFHF